MRKIFIVGITVDVFFISFKESNSEINWQRAKELHPDAVRLHGIQGIDRVHLLCDELCKTEFFWTVDGDNWLSKPLVYNEAIDTDLIMFKANDPLHKNLTLLGGVKLWRKGSIVNRDMSKGDFSLNATRRKIVVDKAYSDTIYNKTPYDAWKTAFRHCVKLMSVIFQSRPNAKNLDTYIEQWKSCKDIYELNANWAYQGYIDAKEYVELFDNNLEELYKINNYEWLEKYFKDRHGTS
jgi:hypothetical protein